MKYFDLIRAYSDNTKIKEQIIAFEKEQNFKLPQLYRALVSTYDLSLIGTEEVLCYYDASHDAKLQLYELKNRVDENLSIEQWYSIDEIIVKNQAIYSDNISIKENYLAIGESFDQGMILIGIAEKNLDEIFLEQAYSEPNIVKINSNVFEFIYDFEIIPMEDYLPNEKKLSDIYKKWGEGFWRICEENQSIK